MSRFSKWLAVKLRSIAAWLDPPIEQFPVPTPEPSAFDLRVSELVRWGASLDGGGEYRRHQVYARLIKEFPDTPKRLIAFSIEKALQ